MPEHFPVVQQTEFESVMWSIFLFLGRKLCGLWLLFVSKVYYAIFLIIKSEVSKCNLKGDDLIADS